MNYKTYIRFLLVCICVILIQQRHAFSDEKLQITHGPYLVEPGSDCITILWTTNKACQSWVEYCGDKNLGVFTTWGGYPKKAYSSHQGLLAANSKLHSVRIAGLNTGTKYRYRVMSKEIIQNNPYEVIFGDTAAGEIVEFETLNPDTTTFSFGVVCDLHEQSGNLNTLLEAAPVDSLNLMFYNGDMLNWIGNEDRIFNGLIDVSVNQFAKEKPMILTRGNHETRGPNARKLFSYFPHSSGNYYHAFSHGNTRFIILDPGEDKPDNHPVYAGLVDFDNYRTEQAEWLRKEVKSDDFLSSKYKIVLMHIPPFSKSSAHGSTDITEKWGPILNNAHIDIIISGHHHRYSRIKPTDDSNQMPVLIVGQDMVLKADVSEQSIKLIIKDKKGKTVDHFSIPAN